MENHQPQDSPSPAMASSPDDSGEIDTLLRGREQLVQSVLDTSLDAIFWLGSAGELVYVNRAACTQLGYSREELLALTVVEICPDIRSVDEFQNLRWKPIKSVGHVRLETSLKCKDGRVYPVEIASHYVSFSGHEIICSIVRDITQLKASVAKLEQISRSHQSMLELLGTSDGVWDWNFSDDRVRFLPGYRKILGFDSNDRTGFPDSPKTFQDHLHPDDRERVNQVRQQQLARRLPYDDEYRLRCKTGTYIWVRERAAAVYDDNGKPLRMTGSIYDITVRKKTEKMLMREQKMLKRSNADLEQFAYVASHDLQEPLRAISGFVQILEQRYRDQLDETGIGYIRKVVDGTGRMQELINGLLEFSRLTSRSAPMKSVELNRVLATVKENLGRKIQESSARIEAVDLPVVDGDPMQLVQLFQNLIDNAIKYCDRTVPEIRITCEKLDMHWQISVADNGIGIDAQHRDQVFSIFKRLHHREQYPGTGIGLAICQRVVERHGGSLSVEDADSCGCKFVIRLPRGGTMAT